MGYCEVMREMIGDSPLIIVRPSVVIINGKGEILLNRKSLSSWRIPGGILQLNESVENCLKRNVQDDLGLIINRLKLFGVYSGLEFNKKPEEEWDNRYQTVAICYLCTDYNGELKPDKDQAIEADFFKLDQLPEDTIPFVKKKLFELKGHIKFNS
jgi:ADP-ribose pyrophosphatase YjhB (NUDIX family)